MKRPDPALFVRARAEFEELVELPPDRRAAELEALALRDAPLAAAVGELLDADAKADALLDAPVAAAVPGLVEAWLEGEPDAGALGAGARVGDWRLVEPLGRGGMGEVWAAEREEGGFAQRGALKLIKRGMDSEEVVRRFRRERQILAGLDHPGIARLVDGGVAADGRLFLVLERVDGRPITEAARALPLERRVALVAEACDAVAAAHARLVVHRDLKPSNILVDTAGRVRLLDFGIAKLLGEGDGAATALTRAEGAPLTPAYAAPEQLLGEPITTATDVWALGTVLFELATGRAPFRRSGTSAVALAREVESETAPRASRVASEIGDPALARALAGDLDTILAKALAREPARRYPTVSALADDLRRWAGGLPVSARAESTRYRVAKFVGRHRVAVASAGLAALALVAASAVSLVQAAKAERSAEESRRQAARAERVQRLLVSILEASDPIVARGEQPTVRQLLAGGAERVERELADEPGLAGEMLDLLASLQRKQGALAEARKLAERSLALRRERFGAESVEAAKSEWTLGWVLLQQGEFESAKAALERSVTRLDREGREGNDAAARIAGADAREPLVELLFASQGPAAAEPLVRERLAVYRGELPASDPRLGVALSDLGVVLFQQSRLDEAEAALVEAAALLDRVLPEDDPRRAYPHNNLSSVYLERGALVDADREARAAIAIRTRALGADHPETAISIGHLAFVDLERERWAEAEAGLREALRVLAGKDPFNAANSKGVLAMALDRQGRSAEALPLFDQAIAELDAIVGERHIVALNPRVNRAIAWGKLGQRARAKSELERLLPILAALGGTGEEAHGRAVSALAALG